MTTPHVWSGACDAQTWSITRAVYAASLFAEGAGWERVDHAGAARGVVALHSAQRDDGLGRWSVVAAAPLATLSGAWDAPVLRDGPTGPARALRGVDPFDALRRLLGPHSALRSPRLEGLPFQGGALGVWGYGCRYAVEPTLLQQATLPKSPVAMESPDLWWGLYDTFVAWDGRNERLYVVSWGLSKRGSAPHAGLARARVRAWLSALDAARDAPEPAAARIALRPAVEQARWREGFDRVMSGIAAGELYQGCLTYPMRAQRPEGCTALGLFARLEALSPGPFAALMVPDGDVALAGSSPERFVRVEQGRAWTRPMKGTRPRGSTEAEDRALREALAASVKDRAENVMIVDLMRNDLGRVCVLGGVSVPELFRVETYRTVHQMTSTVEGRLRPEVDALDVARACFPPGSMTGAPKVRAMQLLDALEPHPRGLYSGALGWLGWGGDAELSVIIRTALVGPRRVDWHVGGGLVADSVAGAEWRESLDKCPAPLRALDAEEGLG